MINYDPRELNLALLTDLYEMTMIQGYYLLNKNEPAVFDMFFRSNPFDGGYTVFAGLEIFLKAVENMKFTPEDIDFLRKQDEFKDEFLDYLKEFRFTGNIYAVEEGEIVFPNEPLIRVEAPIVESQLVETMLLNLVNFPTLIATKTSRIIEQAKGRGVLDFGLRRAQGIDGGVSASRSAYIGGAAGTSNVLAGKIYGIPVSGTMAHSWIMYFGDDLDAFRKYSEVYPQNSVLLVDTYDTLKKGMPAAIKVFQEMKQKNIEGLKAIRLDSGDLEYLSKQARKMLDDAGLEDVKIAASSELDEYIINELTNKEAPIDLFGVGTKLVTAHDDPSLDGVYKIMAKKTKTGYEPLIKVSNNPEKTSIPGIKNVLRLYDEEDIMLGDLVFLEEERKEIEKKLERNEPFEYFHPKIPYQYKTIDDYKKGEFLLKPVMENGRIQYEFPSLNEIREKKKKSFDQLHSSHKRLLNPHIYKVSLSEKLSTLRVDMIKEYLKEMK